MKDKGKKDEMEATPPPAKKEPEDTKGAEDIDTEDTEDEEEEGDMEETYKALAAEMGLAPAPATAAPTAPAAAAPAPAAGTDGGDAVLDGDEFLKAVNAYVDSTVGDVAKVLATTRDVVKRIAEADAGMAKSVAALAEQNKKLREDVDALNEKLGARRAILNIYEPSFGKGGPAPMVAEDYFKKAQDFMAKSALAVERRLVPPTVPAIVQMCIERNVPLASELDARTIRTIEGIAVS